MVAGAVPLFLFRKTLRAVTVVVTTNKILQVVEESVPIFFDFVFLESLSACVVGKA